MDNAGSTNDEKVKKNLTGAYPKIAKQTKLLNTLVIFAFIYTMYLAKSLLIPLFFSAFIALLLSPLVAIARKVFIPRTISAGALIVLVIAPFTLLTVELAEPAERWMHSLPKIAAEVSEEIEEISSSIDAYTTPPAADPVEEEPSIFDWFGDDDSPKLPVAQPDTSNSVTDKIKQSGIDMGLNLFSTCAFLTSAIAWLRGIDLFLISLRSKPLPRFHQRLSGGYRQKASTGASRPNSTGTFFIHSNDKYHKHLFGSGYGWCLPLFWN